MKTTFKRLVAVTLGFFPAIIFPISAIATENGGLSNIKNSAVARAEELTTKRTELCKRFTSSRLGEKSTEKKSSIEKKATERATSLSTKRSEWDEKRIELRSLADGKRLEHYEKLLEKAVTDTRKQAIEDFKSAVETAVTERRATQQAAKDAYRSGVDAAVALQGVDIKSATDELKLAIDAAVAKAKTACENGTPVDEVMEVLRADLQSAKAEFKESRANVSALKEEIKTLAETRKTAVEAARVKFQADIADAKEKLRAAFSSES